MTEGCIFCKIVSGDVPAQVIYQDADTCAFLDNNPLAVGHTLVVPVRHHNQLEDLPDDIAARHLAALPRIVQAVTNVTEADGATVAWNNGSAAGQEVPHLHAHIIPRSDQDGFGPIHSMFSDRPKVSDTEIKHLADRLQLAFTRHA